MKQTIIVFLTSILFLFNHAAFAQNVFMRVNGVSGPSLVNGFTNYFEVSSTGLISNSCSSGTGSCPAVAGDFNFQMLLSNGYLALQQKHLTGQSISTVDFVFTKNTGAGAPQPYYQIHLENVRVKTITQVGGEDGNATEQYALTFQQIAWKYRPQLPNGQLGTAITYCWNYVTNGTSPCNATFPF